MSRARTVPSKSNIRSPMDRVGANRYAQKFCGLSIIVTRAKVSNATWKFVLYKKKYKLERVFKENVRETPYAVIH